MTILGRYESWGRLGNGGMSEVWLARHVALGLPVVLKTLRPEIAARIEDAGASMRESARLMGRCASPGVVRVVDLGTDVVEPGGSAVPCLVEEYVDGLDLAELDARRRAALGRPLPLWFVAAVIAEAASGLHAAHQAGVVHRDVKPANLFADASGRVKVGDFGIAVAPREMRATRVAGTPLFMAPEQLAGGRPDRRADVFSLGATAFALRYGAPPWSDSGELLRGEPIATMPPARSAEEAYFQHVVMHAMAPRPEARPASVQHLGRAMAGLAERARPGLGVAALDRGVYRVGDLRVVLEVGDLARAEVDVIVSSAYSEMRMDQGVGRALRARGGAELETEALAGGPRALGECVETGPGALSCGRVLHAVGAWNEVSCIARAFQRALWIAEQRAASTLALPAIGTGRGRVSLASCADAIGRALRLHAALGSRLEEVRIVLDSAASRDAFDEALAGLWLGDAGLRDEDEVATETSPTAHTAFASDLRGRSERPPAREALA